jgi:negative regulator of sigma-B (phosphoserine phosphatase)
MAAMTASASPGWAVIEWAAAGRGLEAQSGDLHVVSAFPDGALVALIDGLGHGPKAAAAAEAAATVLDANAAAPVLDLLQRCHAGLRKTRGAVMTLASFDARLSCMTWAGVGNVDAALLRAGGRWNGNAAIALRGGVVGFQLPPLRADTLIVAPGDTLVMATDGIHSGFTEGLPMDRPPPEMAQHILDRFAKDSDDAHVVVARYRGAGP